MIQEAAAGLSTPKDSLALAVGAYRLDILRARFRAAAGDLNGALALLRSVEEAMTGVSDPVSFAAQCDIAALLIRQGRAFEASRYIELASSRVAGPTRLAMDDLIDFSELYSEFKIATGKFDDAIGFLDSESRRVIPARAEEYARHLRVLRAEVLLAAGRSKDAAVEATSISPGMALAGDHKLRSRWNYVTGILADDTSLKLKRLREAYAYTTAFDVAERIKILSELWQVLGRLDDEQAKLDFVVTAAGIANPGQAKVTAGGSSEGAHSDGGILVLARLGSRLVISVVDERGSVTRDVKVNPSDQSVALPRDLSERVAGYKRLTILSPSTAPDFDFGILSVDGESLNERLPVRFAGWDDRNEKDQATPVNAKRSAGVLVTPTLDSMTQKTPKLLNRFLAGHHLMDPRTFNEKSLERILSEHELVVLSLPKFGGAESWIPSKFDNLSGASGGRISLDKPGIMRKSSGRFVAILPQANQADDVIRTLMELGADSVVVNRRLTNRDSDVFLLKNLLRYLKTDDICEATRKAAKRTKSYYPQAEDRTRFRVYGRCVAAR